MLILAKKKRKYFWLAVVYTVVFWGIVFSVAPVLLMGLGTRVPMAVLALRQMIYWFLISYVPLPGGSGVAELGFASLFAGFVPKIMLATFVAGWRFLTYHINVLVGAPLFIHLARQVGDPARWPQNS